MAEVSDLQKKYKEKIRPELSKEFGDLNIHATPKLEKIVINSGIGKIAGVRKGRSTGQQTDEEMLEDLINGLAMICGQRPHIVRARKSIAGFKLREGVVVGLHATLRGKKMYEFLTRLVDVALPRTRDFRGIKLKSVDQSGNLTIGIKESSIFPELPPSNFQWGFEVTLKTNTDNRDQALKLFKRLGIPFQKDSA